MKKILITSLITGLSCSINSSYAQVKPKAESPESAEKTTSDAGKSGAGNTVLLPDGKILQPTAVPEITRPPETVPVLPLHSDNTQLKPPSAPVKQPGS
jgi:hypothetical protein